MRPSFEASLPGNEAFDRDLTLRIFVLLAAYDEASWLPLLLALIFTIVAIPVGFWCKEFELGDAQNAVEEDKVIRVKKQSELDAAIEGRQ